MPDVTALPQPGDVFAGKYLIERVIGSGKASLVFGARHRVTGKLFAIEWLLPGVIDTRHDAVIDEHDEDDEELAADGGGQHGVHGVQDEAEVQDVERAEDVRDAEDLLSDADPDHDPNEHHVIGHFRHPNVLEVYDVGEASGSLYTVMEWADGESLDARVQRTGPMSLSEACRLLVPCMRGMHEAHAAGILHRDLKPSNIYICRATRSTAEVVKVLDFEVADTASGAGDTGTLVLRRAMTGNKPYYRAPEQFADGEIDHRADVYAFGAILYEALSGRPPFAPMRHVNREELTPTRLAALQARADKLPLGADTLVGRAMARDVSQRFQTLHELADALEAFCKPHVAQRGMITGRTELSAESVRSLVGSPRPRQAPAQTITFVPEPAVPPSRPWPRPPAIPEAPEISSAPVPAPAHALTERSERRALAQTRDYSERRDATVPRALSASNKPPPAAPSRPLLEWSETLRASTQVDAQVEWSDTSTSRPVPEWSDAWASQTPPEWNRNTDPGFDRRVTQPPFHGHTPFPSGLPSLAPELLRKLRNQGAYISIGLAVAALGFVLVYRWISRDTEVVASFDAVASSDVAGVAPDEPAPWPPAAPPTPQPTAAADLPRGISPDSVPDDTEQQVLRAATAVQVEQSQLTQTSDQRPPPEDDFAAVREAESDSSQAGLVYRLPLKAPSMGSAQQTPPPPQQQQRVRAPKTPPARATAVAKPASPKPVSPKQVTPKPASQKPTPVRRAKAAPAADSSQRPGAPPPAASSDPIPMRLM